MSESKIISFLKSKIKVPDGLILKHDATCASPVAVIPWPRRTSSTRSRFLYLTSQQGTPFPTAYCNDSVGELWIERLLLVCLYLALTACVLSSCHVAYAPWAQRLTIGYRLWTEQLHGTEADLLSFLLVNESVKSGLQKWYWVCDTHHLHNQFTDCWSICFLSKWSMLNICQIRAVWGNGLD